jgi:hypothetical protein
MESVVIVPLQAVQLNPIVVYGGVEVWCMGGMAVWRMGVVEVVCVRARLMVYGCRGGEGSVRL